MRFLRRLILRNLGLKVSGLAISLALWAVYNSGPVVEVGFDAPLALVNLPAGLEVAGEVPAGVRVRVRGRPLLLRRLAPNDLSVNVDCSRARAGSQVLKLALGMVGAPDGTEVVEILPPEIRVSLVSGSAPMPQRK